MVCREVSKYSQSQIEALVEFCERFFKSKVLMGDLEDRGEDSKVK